jgi:hypothetical protein
MPTFGRICLTRNTLKRRVLNRYFSRALRKNFAREAAGEKQANQQ